MLKTEADVLLTRWKEVLGRLASWTNMEAVDWFAEAMSLREQVGSVIGRQEMTDQLREALKRQQRNWDAAQQPKHP